MSPELDDSAGRAQLNVNCPGNAFGHATSARLAVGRTGGKPSGKKTQPI
jgi:hypothetical protein